MDRSLLASSPVPSEVRRTPRAPPPFEPEKRDPSPKTRGRHTHGYGKTIPNAKGTSENAVGAHAERPLEDRETRTDEDPCGRFPDAETRVLNRHLAAVQDHDEPPGRGALGRIGRGTDEDEKIGVATGVQGLEHVAVRGPPECGGENARKPGARPPAKRGPVDGEIGERKTEDRPGARRGAEKTREDAGGDDVVVPEGGERTAATDAHEDPALAVQNAVKTRTTGAQGRERTQNGPSLAGDGVDELGGSLRWRPGRTGAKESEEDRLQEEAKR
jgi:hypothetical protein